MPNVSERRKNIFDLLTPEKQQVRSFRDKMPKEINQNYLLYLPNDYAIQKDKRWPFIFFLHGAGERGTNLERVKTQGLPKWIEQQESFPFLIVSPQCSLTSRWNIDMLQNVLNEMVETYRVDLDRIYVTGLSMGGFATWSLAIANPNRFAAIAPICGGGNTEYVCRIKHLPVWTFHGAKDTIVPIEYSQLLVDKLRSCGGQVRFTVYPEAGHDSWTATYDNPQLYDWFLEQRRNLVTFS